MVLRSYGGDICAKEKSSTTMLCIHAYKQSSLDLGWEFVPVLQQLVNAADTKLEWQMGSSVFSSELGLKI